VPVPDITAAVLPDSFNDGKRYQDLIDLENAYKQLNADVGAFALSTLAASTTYTTMRTSSRGSTASATRWRPRSRPC